MGQTFLLSFFLTLPLWAPPSDFTGRDEMNGIKFSEYKNFLKDWKLVTSRFRKDTGEMRLTYANKIALKTLEAGGTQYEDGAAIAKTGIATGEDPQFTSSMVPKYVRRYQLMVFNKKKYSSTDGWGYGLYDHNGKTFKEDPIETQNACHACHQMVPERGFVFSQPFQFASQMQFLNPRKAEGSKITFRSVKASDLSKELRDHVAAGVKEVLMLENKRLAEHVFQGTLDELKPILEQEVKRAQKPAAFISKDQKKFILIAPLEKADCTFGSAVSITTTDMTGKPVTERVCLHD